MRTKEPTISLDVLAMTHSEAGQVTIHSSEELAQIDFAAIKAVT